MLKMVQRVAVVGAGAAGLAALRRLAARPDLFDVVAFEQTGCVGGTWVYTDNVGVDDNGLPIHSSMYKNLKTNLPKEVMAFPGYAFRKDIPSFTRHQDVLKYLDDFTDQFTIRQFIRFETCVQSVQPLVQDAKLVWEVATRGKQEPVENVKKEIYDAVMVCSGHYSVPLVPDLPGQSTFKGRVEHSHDYRHPEDYNDLRVLCLGAGSSGQDIAIDLATCAKQVYLCHKKPLLQSPLPDNVLQKPGVAEIRNHSILLDNGEELDLDVIMFCTGYHYSFPFLSPDCMPDIHDERVHPVYKHIIHTKYPTLSFIGLCKVICPFPHFDCQVQFVRAALDGSMVLPSQDEMEADIERDYSWRLGRGMPGRHAHHMGNLQWAYNNELAQLANFKPISQVIGKLYDFVHKHRIQGLTTYKSENFELIDDTTFKLNL